MEHMGGSFPQCWQDILSTAGSSCDARLTSILRYRSYFWKKARHPGEVTWKKDHFQVTGTDRRGTITGEPYHAQQPAEESSWPAKGGVENA